MPASPVILGMDCRLYYNTNGLADEGGGTWIELTNVQDVTVNEELNETDASTRLSARAGFDTVVTTTAKVSVDFKMMRVPTDTGFQAIETAYENRDFIAIRVTDGDFATSGTKWVKFDAQVVKFAKNEPLKEASTVDVSLKPTFSPYAPSRGTV